MRLFLLVAGLSLFSAFAAVTTVHYLLPIDPMRTEPLIDFSILFWISLLVTAALLLIGLVANKRID